MGSPLLAIVYVLYIAFVVFAMLNIVTGVFVQSALVTSQEQVDDHMISNIREVLETTHRDVLSSLSWQDFQGCLGRPQMREYFKAIDVHPSEARGVFQLLDLDSSGSIDAEEFLRGCLRLRGPAKALDLALLIHEVKGLAMCFKAHAYYVETKLEEGNYA